MIHGSPFFGGGVSVYWKYRENWRVHAPSDRGSYRYQPYHRYDQLRYWHHLDVSQQALIMNRRESALEKRKDNSARGRALRMYEAEPIEVQAFMRGRKFQRRPFRASLPDGVYDTRKMHIGAYFE